MLSTVFYFTHRFFLLLFLPAAFCIGGLFALLNYQWLDFSALEHYNPGRPSIVLDDQGNEWARFQLDRREPIQFNALPKHLIHAFLAAEDWNFFNHPGISLKGIARSALINIYHGRIVQGASTITQQLVKLLFFDANKTFSRKIKEQLWTLLLERQFTKEQILQTYLNHVYFGCGIYGVEAACQRFWGKSVCDISIDEAAVLAGIIRSPGRYCPLLYPLSSENRRNIVLHSMFKLGFIDEVAYVRALETSVNVVENDKDVIAPHVKEMLRVFLENRVGKTTLYNGGLLIKTTLNITMQKHAEKAFEEHRKKLTETFDPDIEGALISLAVKTGEIKALVGGAQFTQSKFNRALQARRQIGSTFKPLVYAAAIQSGLSFAHTEIDEPIELGNGSSAWRPNNWNKKFNGEITLAFALSHSNNMVSIKTLLRVGAPKVIELAKKCHIKGPFHEYPSLALGCIDANLQEVAGMFNVFANNGMYVKPHIISWVKNKWGTKIYKHEPVEERVMSAHVSGQVAKVLEIGLSRARVLFKQWINSQAISKTGTTNDSRTCWFAGSTPELTTALYIGYDDNRPMGNNVYPIRTALPIWVAYNAQVPAKKRKFSYDPSLKEIKINRKNGLLAYDTRDRDTVSIFV